MSLSDTPLRRKPIECGRTLHSCGMKDKECVRRVQRANLIAIFAALAVDHFTSDPVIAFLNLPEGPVKNWVNTLYIAPFMLAGFWITYKFMFERRHPYP